VPVASPVRQKRASTASAVPMEEEAQVEKVRAVWPAATLKKSTAVGAVLKRPAAAVASVAEQEVELEKKPTVLQMLKRPVVSGDGVSTGTSEKPSRMLKKPASAPVVENNEAEEAEEEDKAEDKDQTEEKLQLPPTKTTSKAKAKVQEPSKVEVQAKQVPKPKAKAKVKKGQDAPAVHQEETEDAPVKSKANAKAKEKAETKGKGKMTPPATNGIEETAELSSKAGKTSPELAPASAKDKARAKAKVRSASRVSDKATKNAVEKDAALDEAPKQVSQVKTKAKGQRAPVSGESAVEQATTKRGAKRSAGKISAESRSDVDAAGQPKTAQKRSKVSGSETQGEELLVTKTGPKVKAARKSISQKAVEPEQTTAVASPKKQAVSAKGKVAATKSKPTSAPGKVQKAVGPKVKGKAIKAVA